MCVMRRAVLLESLLYFLLIPIWYNVSSLPVEIGVALATATLQVIVPPLNPSANAAAAIVAHSHQMYFYHLV